MTFSQKYSKKCISQLNKSVSTLSKGFTLIELLLTISLITLLAGAVLTATGASKTQAKEVKVKSDIKEIERSLQSHDVGVGGFPNPDPGQKKVYCVGSTKCMLDGKPVTTYINPLTGEISQTGEGQTYQYTDLISFSGANGETRGYMYVSCGGTGVVCNDPNTVGLIYPQSAGAQYVGLQTNATSVAFNADGLGIIASSYIAGVGSGYDDSFAYPICGETLPADLSHWNLSSGGEMDFYYGYGWCTNEVPLYYLKGPSAIYQPPSNEDPCTSSYGFYGAGDGWETMGCWTIE